MIVSFMKRVILFAPLNVIIEIYIVDQIIREHTIFSQLQ